MAVAADGSRLSLIIAGVSAFDPKAGGFDTQISPYLA
jgi:hypothetical protein